MSFEVAIAKLVFAGLLVFGQHLPQQQLGTIAGRIRTPSGDSVRRVEVAAIAVGDDSVRYFASTDDTGRYRIAGIPPGRYHVVVGPRAAVPDYHPGTKAPVAATVFTVTAGSFREDANFSLRNAFAVRGRLKMAAESLPRMLRIGPADRYVAQSPVRPDGTFEFSNVPPGYSVFEFQHAGRSRITAGIIVNGDIDAIEILTGRVVPEDRNAFLSQILQGLPLTIAALVQPSLRSGQPPPAMSPVADDLFFTIVAPDGDYRLALRNHPMGYGVRSISTAPSGEIIVAVVKAPPTGVSVTGNVTGDVRSGKIRLVGVDSGHVSETSTGRDGAFTFPAVPPGLYRVVAWDIPSVRFSTSVAEPRDWWVQVANENIHGIRFPVTVTRGIGEYIFQFSSVNNPAVRGRIIVDTDAAPPNAFLRGVMVGLSGAAPALTSVREDGTFDMPLLPGSHSVFFEGLPAGYSIKTMTAGSVNLVKDALRRADDEVRIVLEFNARSAAEGRSGLTNGSISGTLLRRDGKPAADVRVHARDSTNPFIAPLATTTTDDAGRYRLENLPPGQYQILVGRNPQKTGPGEPEAVLISRPATNGQTSPTDATFSITHGSSLELGPATNASGIYFLQ